MESVAEAVGSSAQFDAVFVYEALHHAYSWEEALQSSYDCLKPGGKLVIANEPNLAHTFISYRISRLTNTHEIGMSRKKIIRVLRQTGFDTVKIEKNRMGFALLPHWIVAQKPEVDSHAI